MVKRKLPRGIRQRGQKFFVDVTVNGKRRTATVNTDAEAVAKQYELKVDLETGREPASKGRSNARAWTLKDALDKTLSLPKPEGWRDTAYGPVAKLAVDEAIKTLGPDILLQEINRDLIDAWVHSCEASGNSNSTINRKLSALSKVMGVAIEHGGLLSKPKFPPRRKEPVGRIRQLSKDEEAQLLRTFRHLGYGEHADVVTVLIDTGMRLGELWNLRPQDIDIKTNTLMIYGEEGKGTKNGKIRSVPMTKRVRATVVRYQTRPLLFPRSKTWMRHPWDRVRALMGLSEDKNFSPHVCRHTCASRLVAAGIPLPVVQQYLGHNNIQTTMKYVHLLPTALVAAAEALEGE